MGRTYCVHSNWLPIEIDLFTSNLHSSSYIKWCLMVSLVSNKLLLVISMQYFFLSFFLSAFSYFCAFFFLLLFFWLNENDVQIIQIFSHKFLLQICYTFSLLLHKYFKYSVGYNKQQFLIFHMAYVFVHYRTQIGYRTREREEVTMKEQQQ